MFRSLLGFVLVVTACDASKPPSCESAVRLATKATGESSDDKIAAKVARCIREKWTATVRSCLAGATTSESARSCISGREVAKEPANEEPAPARPADIREAELNLESISSANLRAFAEEAGFVVGTAGPTPAKPCCSFSSQQCPSSSAAWKTPVWQQLDFEMTSDHRFQYTYKGSGETFEATAVGDLDCDGKPVKYTLRGRIKNGSPEFSLSRPSNAD